MLPALLLLACAASEPGAVSVATDPLAPTVATVSWTSDQPGRARVEVLDEDGVALQTPWSDELGTEHEVVVLGLAEGRLATLQPVVETEAGERLEARAAELQLPPAPEGVARFARTAWDPDRVQQGPSGGGWVLASTLSADASWVILLDRLGRVVWYFSAKAGMSVATAKPGLDGQSVLMAQHDREQQVDEAVVVRMPLRGGTPTETRTVDGHHDFVELPGGELAWLALELADNDDPDLTELPQIAGDALLLGSEGQVEGEPTTRLFSFLDDYREVWSPCYHFGIGAYNQEAADWTHANSLAWLKDQDRFLVGSRNLDAVFAIDAGTGALQWQLGGDYATLDGDGLGFSHGHFSQAWQGGLAYFDNGVHYDPPHSRALELAIDEQTGQAVVAWEYWEPEGRSISMMGDVRKLPGGNYLVAWSTAGLLTELTPDGDEVWRLEADLGHVLGRVHWVADLYDLNATVEPGW